MKNVLFAVSLLTACVAASAVENAPRIPAPFDHPLGWKQLTGEEYTNVVHSFRYYSYEYISPITTYYGIKKSLKGNIEKYARVWFDTINTYPTKNTIEGRRHLYEFRCGYEQLNNLGFETYKLNVKDTGKKMFLVHEAVVEFWDPTPWNYNDILNDQLKKIYDLVCQKPSIYILG